MIRVILWDVDNTLLDFLAAESAAVRRCFELFGLGPCTDEMIRVYSGINVRYWEKLERREMTKPEILVNRFREFFAMYGVDTAAAERFNDEYQVRLGDTIVFFPGAMETIAALRGLVRQYGVTNGTRVAQRRKLKLSGLGDALDGVFISEDVGYEKPDIRFFERVFSAVGDFSREEIMIVGDSLTSDMLGGVNAGIVTCWFNPGGKENKLQLPIDHEISDLSQVLTLLG